jgi:hypothetical protein
MRPELLTFCKLAMPNAVFSAVFGSFCTVRGHARALRHSRFLDPRITPLRAGCSFAIVIARCGADKRRTPMNVATKRQHACKALLAGGLALLSVPAGADGEWKPGGRVEDQVRMMDGNGDGRVSPQEHAAGAKLMFEKIDADHDGEVTATEMDAAHAAAGSDGGGLSSADKIRTIDGDGNGSLSAAEHEAGSQAMFVRTDANRDGSVDVAEMKAAHEAMLGKHDGKQGAEP